MLSSDGFLAPASYFGADLALVGEIVFYLLICVAVVAQRRGNYHLHDRIQIPVVVGNFFFVIVIMVLSLRYENVPVEFAERPFEPFYLVVVIHAVLGIVAQMLATYCLLAGTKILPRKIGRLRYWMWATFAVWTAAVVMGIYTYYIWYIVTPERPHLF
ncbi:MAG: DUF420 domain-containing protein [Anaerolineales bacterium]|nr:DUF420 domain-containing protein [Anaerolineales bacterium]MCB8939488.1 DUF420 domain-containing protein [Ardenticatenaceae bacterium]